jgi:hypothetical protein
MTQIDDVLASAMDWVNPEGPLHGPLGDETNRPLMADLGRLRATTI